MTPSLFDLLEPTVGRTRATDPETSAIAARRCKPGSQRFLIACWFACGRDYADADSLAQADPVGRHRSTWSARLGDLCRDGVLRRSDPVPGASQSVLSYVLTETGAAWVRRTTREGR